MLNDMFGRGLVRIETLDFPTLLVDHLNEIQNHFVQKILV